MTFTIAPELAAALVAAQQEIKHVGKTGRNKFYGYDYSTAEDMIAAGRSALNSAGLALDSSAWSFVAAGPDAPPPVEKLPSPIGRVIVSHMVIHASGAFMVREASTPVIPEKGRPADKAEFAALTANLSYFLRNLLQIPRGDDPGAGLDERDDGEGEEAPPVRPAPFQRPPARDPMPSAAAPVVAVGDDVPFDVHPGEAPMKAAPPSDDWSEVVKGAIQAIGERATVADKIKALREVEMIPLSPRHLALVREATVTGCLALASTMAELASAIEIARSLKDNGVTSADWHAATGKAYQARRAALSAAPAAK